jgi:hypothetical protein
VHVSAAARRDVAGAIRGHQRCLASVARAHGDALASGRTRHSSVIWPLA